MDAFIDAWPNKIKPFDSWVDSVYDKTVSRGRHQMEVTNRSRCRYCRRQFDDNAPKTKDHIVPVSKFGLDKKENRVPCCFDCNQWKDNKTLEDWLKELQKIIKKEKKIRPPYNKNLIGLMIGSVKKVMDEIEKNKSKVSIYKI